MKKDWERDVIWVLGKVRLGKGSKYDPDTLYVYMYGIFKQMKITRKANIIENKL